MARREMPVRHAVVQQDAGVAGGHAGAEARIQALDAGHRIAVRIDHAEIRRVADRRFRLRQREIAGARHVDRRGAFIGIGVGQQPIQRHVAEARVGAVALAIEERALLRLHQHVDAPHRIERGKVEALGDLQHLQHGEAGGVRRRLRHAEAAIGDADRVLQLRLERLEVAFIDQHAGLAHAGGEAAASLPR